MWNQNDGNMQITVTDINEHEGERFGFILEVDESTANQIKDGIADFEEFCEVEFNTDWNQEKVDLVNKTSRNSYMNRIGFYELKRELPEEDMYYDLFYKGVGLQKQAA